MTNNLPNVRAVGLEYLEKNRLMTIATTDADRPWAVTVFFAYTGAFQLYFFSDPKTVHCQHIEQNPNVAGTINQHNGLPHGVKGMQFVGRASRVEKTEYDKAYRLYKKRFDWADDFASDHILYVINPLELYYIDEEIFGHNNRVQIIAPSYFSGGIGL